MKIEKGIPIPVTKMGRPRKYDFDKMEVGDCVTMPVTYQAAHTTAARTKKRNPGWDFVIKHDKKSGKTQVWRTA